MKTILHWALRQTFGGKRGGQIIAALENNELVEALLAAKARDAIRLLGNLPSSLREEIEREAMRRALARMPEPGRSAVKELLKKYAPEVLS